MNQRVIIMLYDKDDVLEFNQNNNNYKNVFLFSPGLEIFLNKKKELNIYKAEVGLNKDIYKNVIIDSKKIYYEYEKNMHYLEKLDKGLNENIHNIFFVSVFSYIYLIENSKNFDNFGIFYDNQWQEFENFKEFIPIFIRKISIKKNQGFFNYIKSKKLSKLKKLLISFNNSLCYLNKSSNNLMITGSILAKKIFNETEQKISIFQLKPSYDFRFYHLFLNLFFLISFFKKKNFYFFPIEKKVLKDYQIKKNLELFFKNFSDKNLNLFKEILLENIDKYCENQTKSREDVYKIVEYLKPKHVLVDQLRFGISTVLASICFKKKIDVILVPHGSISVPSDEISNFVLSICARGLVYSGIANYAVSQSKISYNAIKYYDKNLKILKSKPLLFGKNTSNHNLNKSGKFTFLHASTPKSLAKWPWIYESYNEYVNNIKELIEYFKSKKNIELIIRFREGPECDLETFKNLVNIKQNSFVKISKNNNFFDDLNISDCLISFSSTSIEEALFSNKRVLIYSGYREYKHINFKFNSDDEIIYANKKNINHKIDIILNNDKKINYNINWTDNVNKEEDFRKFYK